MVSIAMGEEETVEAFGLGEVETAIISAWRTLGSFRGLVRVTVRSFASFLSSWSEEGRGE